MSDKTYTNGEITIHWKPDSCIHSRICWHKAHGLPEVFNPAERPWIKMDGSNTERIKEQVDKCPSGALSYQLNDAPKAIVSEATTIDITTNGPLIVKGNVILQHPNGDTKSNDGVMALCRCGASRNKPFCDGAHKTIDFQTEI